MKDKLKLVDGTGNDKSAPRPHHGLIRAVYDTVDACGGANIKQIKQYLPAAIDNIGQVLRKGKLNRSLYHAVYQGYLIHDGKTGYWRIAPMSYYVARRAHIDNLAEERVHRGAVPEPYKEQSSAQVIEPSGPDYLMIRIDKRFLMVVAVVALVAAGFAAGRLI